MTQRTGKGVVMARSEREKLIEYLDTHCIDTYGELRSWMVADFILADRRRIVEPLIEPVKKADRLTTMGGDLHSLFYASKQVLVNAGVTL